MRTVQYPAVQCQDSRFFRDRVRQRRAHVRRFVRESAGLCTRPAPGRVVARVPSEWVQDFRRRDPHAPEAVLVALRAGPASAMFPVA